MTEHRIKFRGGWMLASDAPQRLTLPLHEWPEGPAPYRLVRDFQPPALQPGVETLALALEETPGLRWAMLNGRPLPAGDGGPIPLEPSLPRRCRLEIEIDPEGPPPPGGWGAVALVVRSSGATVDEGNASDALGG